MIEFFDKSIEEAEACEFSDGEYGYTVLVIHKDKQYGTEIAFTESELRGMLQEIKDLK